MGAFLADLYLSSGGNIGNSHAVTANIEAMSKPSVLPAHISRSQNPFKEAIHL
jgi:hypothetical protein